MPPKVKIEVDAPSRGQPAAAKAFSGAIGDPDSKPLLRVGLSSPHLSPNPVERVVVFALFLTEKLQTSSNPP